MGDVIKIENTYMWYFIGVFYYKLTLRVFYVNSCKLVYLTNWYKKTEIPNI